MKILSCGYRFACGFAVLTAIATAADPIQKASEVELLEVRKIWDQGEHNAFTDLILHNKQWICVFREATTHISPDGVIRVLVSPDAENWKSAAALTAPEADLRDPKITITPNGRLMLTAVQVDLVEGAKRHRTLVWFSDDGASWSTPTQVGEDNIWLWRVTWLGKTAYATGYSTREEKFVRLYKSSDGVNFEPLVPALFAEGYPNEGTLIFLPDSRALFLLRRDGEANSAQLGTAAAPYTEWTWTDTGRRIGGPNLVRLADGRLLVAGRLYDGGVRTSLCWLDAESGDMDECLALPSGGDTSYPGLVVRGDVLRVSYYSSHEGRTSIYLAKVKLPAAR